MSSKKKLPLHDKSQPVLSFGAKPKPAAAASPAPAAKLSASDATSANDTESPAKRARLSQATPAAASSAAPSTTVVDSDDDGTECIPVKAAVASKAPAAAKSVNDAAPAVAAKSVTAPVTAAIPKSKAAVIDDELDEDLDEEEEEEADSGGSDEEEGGGEGEGAAAASAGAGSASKSRPASKAKSTSTSKKSSKKGAAAAAGPTPAAKLALSTMQSNNYHPVRDASWAKSKSPDVVPFSAVSDMFDDVSGTTLRLSITSYVSTFLRSVIALAPADLLACVYLCTNTIAPAYEAVELNVGEKTLVKALCIATGRQAKDIEAEAAISGDLATVAVSSRAKQSTLGSYFAAKPPPRLTVRSVFATYKAIAAAKGPGSVDKRISLIRGLLVAAVGNEALYVARAMMGKLRIGLLQSTVHSALAHAFTYTEPYVAERPHKGPSSGQSSITAFLSVSSSFATSTTAAAATGDGDADDEIEMVADDTVADASSVTTMTASLPILPSSCEVYYRTSAASASSSSSAASVVGASASFKSSAPAAAAAAAPATDSEPPYPPVILDSRKRYSASEFMQRLTDSVVLLKEVYSELPSYDRIIPALLRGGIDGARDACHLTAGIPVSPMLAKPMKGISQILDRFEGISFTCEWKYDGERAQVHRTPDGTFTVFSRRSENSTGKYPDLAGILGEAANEETTSCIVDGEVMAYDREANRILPFQTLSTRAKKNVAIEDITVQVFYAAFDLLYLNGQSLLKMPFVERRRLLKSAFHQVPGRFDFAVSMESNDVEEIGAFLNESIKGGCEGLMIKVLDGPESAYVPFKRSVNWLKLKKDYMEGLTDSVDLVPVAAWRGKGKRTGVYGAYLLACYDPDEEVYQAITKIGTGFSDENLALLTGVFDGKDKCIVDSKPANVEVGDTMDEPDVWFDPEESEIWEVKAADLSISPMHKAARGKVDPDKGIALRFPRFMRRRDDKSPSDATTAEQIADMYSAQGIMNNGKAGGDDDSQADDD